MKKFSKLVSGITALSLAWCLSLTASAELHTGDKMSYKGTGFRARYEVTSSENGVSTVKVTLMNTGRQKIGGWAVKFENFGDIQGVKACRMFSSDGVNSILMNSSTNGSVAPNKTVSFSYTVSDKYGDCEFPERIKVYSDIDRSNSVDDLNLAAKECYNAACDALVDNEVAGISVDASFREGLFAKSNSKDGMRTGFNYRYAAAGDNKVNIAASQYSRGSVCVYTGRTTVNGEETVFVQVKDLRTGRIGQYPHPTNGTAEWGTLDLSSPVTKVYSQKEVDSAAKSAYNVVMGYLSEVEANEGMSASECYSSGAFAESSSTAGLKLDPKAVYDGCDKHINDVLKYEYEGMTINVMMTAAGEVIVDAKANDGTMIGQYPLAFHNTI